MEIENSNITEEIISRRSSFALLKSFFLGALGLSLFKAKKVEAATWQEVQSVGVVRIAPTRRINLIAGGSGPGSITNVDLETLPDGSIRLVTSFTSYRPMGGCFLSHSLILDSNFEAKRIFDIEAGDYVLDHNSKPTKVLEKRIHLLGKEKLFDISGETITTARHFLFTTESWSSIQPEIDYIECLQNDLLIYSSVMSEELLKEYGASRLSLKHSKELKAGSKLLLINKEIKEIEYIKEVTHYPEETMIITLTTESGSFVLANGIIVDGLTDG